MELFLIKQMYITANSIHLILVVLYLSMFVCLTPWSQSATTVPMEKKLLLRDLLSNITTYGVIVKIPFNCVLLQSHSFSNKLNNHRGPKEGSIQGPIIGLGVSLSYLPFVLEVQAKILMKASNFVHAHPGFHK